MVNSFGKINSMQSMERPKLAVKVPCFFPFKVLGGGGGAFFSFSPSTQCVPTILPLISNGFPSGFQNVPHVPNVFHNMFSIAPHFYPICFGKCCPRLTYIAWPKGRNSKLQNKNL